MLFLFIKWNKVTLYKQTILDPQSYFIQPLDIELTDKFVFNNIAIIPKGDVVPLSSKLSGIMTCYNFGTCLNGSSITFKSNPSLFGRFFIE